MPKIELIQGDCLEVMKSIPDKSVDLTVTSPPYDNLRTYNSNNDLWGEHVWKAVIADLFRVTKHGGVVVWVVGDATINGSETGTSFRQALWAMECGFRLHDTMIFHKESPPSKTKRYEQHFEYMFVLSKGAPMVFNAILVDSKRAGWANKSATSRDKNGKLHPCTRINPIAAKKKASNIWKYAVGRRGSTDTMAHKHPAIYPERLAHDHIISWSNEGDTVLDCFMGSGTTGVACKNLNRNFIGIELDPEYFKIAEKRINENL